MFMYNNTNLALNNELVFVHVFCGNNTLQKEKQNLDLINVSRRSMPLQTPPQSRCLMYQFVSVTNIKPYETKHSSPFEQYWKINRSICHI